MGAALVLALALARVAAPGDARATCMDPNIIGAASPNTGYVLGTEEYAKMNISRPFWTGLVIFPNNHSTDYDVYVYSNGSGGVDPFCFSGLLANSTYGPGHTDFVVGDFNHNPAGTYWGLGHCYSGTCASGPSDGIWCWRDGDLVTVNAAPTSQYIDPNSNFPDQMLHCYDVYLTAGTTYFFHFTNTGPNDIKMCLFHNTTNGVYWAGRSSAVFEVTSCATYQAPSTGYYGIAIVTDTRYNVADTYTLAVSTTPDCNCPQDLASGVPQTELATQTYGMHRATQQLDPFWMAVGTRASGTSDWDIDLGPPSGASDACLSGVDAASAQSPPNADVVAGDFNFGALPYTEAVQTNRFSGSDGASTEMDAGPDQLSLNAYKVTGAMNANDVVKIWDANSQAGDSLTYELQAFGANINLLLFENTAHTRVWKSRSSAVMTTSGKQAFKTTVSGFHGVALVKDDGNSGSYLLRYGRCDSPVALASRVLDEGFGQRWYSFSEPDTVWTAAGVYDPDGIYGPAIDSDIQQADAPTGSAWPDCFGSLGALSQSSSQMDFVVGDFHHQAPGMEYVHSYPFTSNRGGYGFTEWDAGRGSLKINAAPTAVALSDSLDPYADRLFCYQVYLIAGQPYTFEFSQTGTVDTHLMLFRNPGTAKYWAPRSAALFSVTSNQAYSPAGAGATGWYAVVVTNENMGGGGFSLRVSSTTVGVPNAGAAIATRLTRVAPNPARGAVRIEYAKAADDAAEFEVLDMAGRVIARIDAPGSATGAGEVTWNGRNASGSRAPAGIYFVRMRVAGREVETRKLAIMN